MTDDQPANPTSEPDPSTKDPSSLKGLTMALGIQPADPDHDPLLGRDIGGVTIEKPIAEGGMGRVYEGLQERPRRKVAVKVMRPGFVSRETSQRFAMELEILGRLRHPYIAQIYSAGMCDVVGSQVPFFVMEYIPDALPITRYAKEKLLGIDARIALFQKVCEAVAHGHEQGIVHRDLKPGNILVEPNGTPKIIDFGIARSVSDTPEKMTALTELGQLIGTLQYMSPEQIDADPTAIDQRTDVYALGVILYELLTGVRPYEISSKQIFDAGRIIRKQKPVSPLKHNRHLRPGVVKITGTCLQKDRGKRFANAADLSQAVGRYLATEAVADVPSALIIGTTWRTRALLAAGFLMACLGVAVYGFRGGPEQPATSQSRPDDSQAAVEPTDQPSAVIPAGHKLENSLGMKFVLIPSGTFQMGSHDGDPDEKPVHEVRLTKPFYLGVTEVTNAQWKAVMGDVPSKWKDDNKPVEQVTWDEVLTFCQKVSALPAEKAARREYRLPSEAEWEYSCRAGTNTAFSYGDNHNSLNDYGWFRATADMETKAVAQRKPNPWGLYDMHGNVWEMVSDCYAPYENDPVSDPRGSPAASDHVIRGGSWNDTRGICRSAKRGTHAVANRQNNVGVRLALSVPQSSQRGTGAVSVDPAISTPPSVGSDDASPGPEKAGPQSRAEDTKPTQVRFVFKKSDLEEQFAFDGDVLVNDKNEIECRGGKLSRAVTKEQFKIPLHVELDVYAYANRVFDLDPAVLTDESGIGGIELHYGTYNNTQTQLYVFGKVRRGLPHTPIEAGHTYRIAFTIAEDRTLMVSIDGKQIHKETLPENIRKQGHISLCGGFGHCAYRRLTVKSGGSIQSEDHAGQINERVWGQSPLVNSVGMKLMRIPSGTFQLGSNGGDIDEQPVHEVQITAPFYIGVYEVTNRQWKAVMRSSLGAHQDDERPVSGMTWQEAVEFCKTLSTLPDERTAGRAYRLPTEAEWEYSCRAGTIGRYSFGDDESLLDEYGWYQRNSGIKTNAVGLKKPNPWGLHDMHGNVSEWCGELFKGYPTDATGNARAKAVGSGIWVIRGGGYGHQAEGCRSAKRYKGGGGGASLGFRVAMSLVKNDVERIEAQDEHELANVFLTELPIASRKSHFFHNRITWATIGGKSYDEAIHIHPEIATGESTLVFALDGSYHELSGAVGILDSVKHVASPQVFRIVGDGKDLWKSSPHQKPGMGEAFRVNVVGVKALELRTSCANGKAFDAHCVWIDPQLTKGSTSPQSIQGQ